MKSKYLNTHKPFIYRALALSFLSFFLSISLSADTFTTSGPGNWTDGSTWGGTAPPTKFDGDDHTIFVQHRVTLQTNGLTFEDDAILHVEDILICDGGVQMNSGSPTINVTGGVMIFNNSGFQIKAGVVNNNGGIQHCNGDFLVDGGTLNGTGYIFTQDKVSNSSGSFGSNVTCCATTYESIPAGQQDCSAFTAANGWDGCLDEEFTFALPVELTYFKAIYDDKNVQIHWNTASELNNAGFEIEHSIDARNWKKTSFVSGNGTTLVPQSYSYTDKNPMPGVNYYRLKQLDFDGAFEYSKTVSVKVAHEDDGISLFPNPATGFVTLATSGDYSGGATFQLYDMMGRQIIAKQLIVEEGDFLTNIELEYIPAGVYIAQLHAGSEKWEKRLMVK